MSISVSEKNKEETVVTVAKDYLKRPQGVQKMILQPSVLLFDWAKWFFSTLSYSASQLRKLLGGSVSFFSFLDLPRRVQKIASSVTRLAHSILKRSALEIGVNSARLFKNITFATMVFSDAAIIAHQEKLIIFSPLALKVVNIIGFLGGFSLFLKGIFGIQKQYTLLKECKFGDEHFNFHLIKLIGKIFCMALGIFGMISFASGGALVAQGVFLAVSSGYLLFPLIAHFYQKIRVANYPQKAV